MENDLIKLERIAHNVGIPQVLLPLANSDYLIYGISKTDIVDKWVDKLNKAIE